MRITNSRRGSLLAEKTELARGMWKKMLGLMFRAGIDDGAGLLMQFEKESSDMYSIWMLGMRFPIDIIFIDKNKKVTDVYSNVPPVSFNPGTWKIYRPTKPVKWILEVRAGKARETGTSVGDGLSFG